jgi:pSer/pThr/pTyr-binding forkhead associated (FHA) protein
VPESLLTILKFLLMALLYLFFLRVLRAVWAEVATPAPTPTTTSPASAAAAKAQRRGRDSNANNDDATVVTANPLAKGTPAKLRVVEPAEQRGHAFALTDEMTVGRAAGCQVRVDDSYASQLHARIFRRDGQLFVEDLGSTNGTYVNRKGTSAKETVNGPLALRTGDRLCIGRTVLEVTR